jgi:hypothetical protein
MSDTIYFLSDGGRSIKVGFTIALLLLSLKRD